MEFALLGFDSFFFAFSLFIAIPLEWECPSLPTPAFWEQVTGFLIS